MRRLAMISAAVLMLTACEDQPGPDTLPLHVTGQQEQVPAYWAGLSPDGRTLLYGKDSLCVRGVDGSNEFCLDADGDPTNNLYPANASWSPDGGRLAITEAYPAGVEPDVWVVDIASGKRTNLTDDGVVADGLTESGPPQFPDDAVVDLYPSWSADGERIRFLRKDPDGMALMSTPAAGGAPTRLGSINVDWTRLRAVAWTEKSIAWASRDNEVWVAGVSGGKPHKVLDGAYRVLSFSSDGAFLLADQIKSNGEAETGKARVVPARGGDPVPVAAGAVRYPTWSPTGHAIAYVDNAVKVVGEPGGEPGVLHEGTALGAADSRSLDWVRGAILVRSGPTTPVVLRIDG